MIYVGISYIVLYSIVCFLVVKNIFKSKFDDINTNYLDCLDKINQEVLVLKQNIESNFDKTREDILTQNQQYLSQMNDSISDKIKELSDTVKNRRVI
jgi:hypothetical protein